MASISIIELNDDYEEVNKMGTQLLGYLLLGNVLILSLIYIYIFKIRKLIGFQLGMSISSVSGGLIGIITGVILIYQFPLKFVTVTIITTLMSMFVGAIFGALFDYQTLLVGYGNGVMTGIMAPMIGAAAKGSLPFLLFLEGVFLFTLILLIISAKRT